MGAYKLELLVLSAQKRMRLGKPDRAVKPAGTPIIKTDELIRRFDYLLALDHLGSEVKEGEVLKLPVPKGVGKRKIGRMLACFILPQVQLFGDLWWLKRE